MRTWTGAVTDTSGREASRPVGQARVLIGAAALVKAWAIHPVLWRLSEPGILTTPYVAWIPRPSGSFAVGLLLLWTLSALALTLGWHARLAGGVLTAVLAMTLALDQQLYSNHLYLLALMTLLLTLAHPGAALSLDARRTGLQSSVPAWPVMLLRCQVSIVYLFSALAKLNAAYLSGSVLASEVGSGMVGLPDGLHRFEAMAPIAFMSILVEVFLALGLWSPRIRPAAIGLGVLMHVSFVLLLTQPVELAVFATIMFAGYVLFPTQRQPGQGAGRQAWLPAE